MLLGRRNWIVSLTTLVCHFLYLYIIKYPPVHFFCRTFVINREHSFWMGLDINIRMHCIPCPLTSHTHLNIFSYSFYQSIFECFILFWFLSVGFVVTIPNGQHKMDAYRIFLSRSIDKNRYYRPIGFIFFVRVWFFDITYTFINQINDITITMKSYTFHMKSNHWLIKWLLTCWLISFIWAMQCLAKINNLKERRS